MVIVEPFLADPAAAAKNFLRFIHFIGLALGLGGATLLDLTILRFFFRNKISPEACNIVEFASKIVDAGLKILWVSGAGFLIHYALLNPELLANPKVHAKLAIVAVLTINGVFIHTVVLPGLKAQQGRFIFSGVSEMRRLAFIASGAVSAVSWYFPVALGAFSQLNHTVPAYLLISLYAGAIVCAALGMHIVTRMLHAHDAPVVGSFSMKSMALGKMGSMPEQVAALQAALSPQKKPTRGSFGAATA